MGLEGMVLGVSCERLESGMHRHDGVGQARLGERAMAFGLRARCYARRATLKQDFFCVDLERNNGNHASLAGRHERDDVLPAGTRSEARMATGAWPQSLLPRMHCHVYLETPF